MVHNYQDNHLVRRWLEDNKGKKLWSVGDKERRVEAWEVNGRTALIVYSPDELGWQVYTAISEFNVAEIFGLIAKQLKGKRKP